jgi:uncharacterized protein YdaU (DUF1376 family)
MSRKRSPWFAFYVDDWLGGTRRMTAAAKGAFIELLCDQFANGSIPQDEDQIQMIAGVRPDEWASIRASVLSKFEDDGDGGLINRRMEKEREEREEIRQKRISAGSKGGSKKVANAKANGSSLPVASTSTSTSTSTTVPKGTTAPTPIDGVGGGIEIGKPMISLEAAKSNAGLIAADVVELWWHARDAVEWVDRSGRPIKRWRSDLTAFAASCQQNRADRANRNGKAHTGEWKEADGDIEF